MSHHRRTEEEKKEDDDLGMALLVLGVMLYFAFVGLTLTVIGLAWLAKTLLF